MSDSYKQNSYKFYLPFSFDLLSLIIFISFDVIKVQLFSLAHVTHPFKTNLRNGLGTLTKVSKASSLNFTTSSARFAAYLIKIEDSLII